MSSKIFSQVLQLLCKLDGGKILQANIVNTYKYRRNGGGANVNSEKFFQTLSGKGNRSSVFRVFGFAWGDPLFLWEGPTKYRQSIVHGSLRP